MSTNFLDMPTCVSIPAAAHSHDGFDRWVTSDEFPDRCRATWIRGEILIDMSPEEIQSHSRLKTEISRVLATFIKKHRLGQYYSDRTLLSNDDADLSTEPDGMFVSTDSMKARRIVFVPTENDADRYLSLAGTPDWVVELVSKSSVIKDTRLLKRAYLKAGVPEYWLIDARKQEMAIQVFTFAKSGYKAVPVKRGRWKSSLFRVEFHLYRERDEFGYWEYTLDHTEPK
jgi:Uma2 family endonuclease